MIKELITKQWINSKGNWVYEFGMMTEEGYQGLMNGEGKDFNLINFLETSNDLTVENWVTGFFAIKEIVQNYIGSNFSDYGTIIEFPAKYYLLIADQIDPKEWEVSYSLNTNKYYLERKNFAFLNSIFYTKVVIPILKLIPYHLETIELKKDDNIKEDYYSKVGNIENPSYELDNISKFILEIK